MKKIKGTTPGLQPILTCHYYGVKCLVSFMVTKTKDQSLQMPNWRRHREFTEIWISIGNQKTNMIMCRGNSDNLNSTSLASCVPSVILSVQLVSPPTEHTCKHTPLPPTSHSAGCRFGCGCSQIPRHHGRITMRVLGGISCSAQSHTGEGLCKTLASWALCQFKMTNKWYQEERLAKGGGGAATLHAAASSSLHTNTPLLFMHRPGYVSCLVIAGLMCVFSHICWLCSSVAHFEATTSPYPPFVFPFICSNERGWDLSTSPLSSVWLVNFLFFLDGLPAVVIHSALTPQRFLKYKNRCKLKCFFSTRYALSSAFFVLIMRQCFKYHCGLLRSFRICH